MDVSLRVFVVERSAGRCEYCQIPQRFFTELFQIEHIVARQHRGMTIESNLAIACSRCNLHKGPNLAGIDPLSEVLVRLFNPRIDIWTEHFHLALSGEMTGKSNIGSPTRRTMSWFIARLS